MKTWMVPDRQKFYKENQFGYLRSAREVVPLVIEILRPSSVIDVGCGIGTWLSVFREHGIEDILGVDSDYVYRKMLQIPEDRFLGFDLRQPLRLNREFDLALSLEVAEHLPSECAETFVDSLARLAPAILFAAAIPYQGGEHHLNEQWPNYWAGFFRKKEYTVIDCIRRKIWENDAVDWWYAQNTLLFVRKSYVEEHPFLKSLPDCYQAGLAVVHPKKYASVVSDLEAAYDPRNVSLRQVLSLLPSLTMRSLKRRARVFSGRKVPD
jgi:SAM-dependent methyltransferase